MTQDKPPLPDAEREKCGCCIGSGWVARDVDIGTDTECPVCDGKGTVSTERYTPQQLTAYADTCTAALSARVAELEADALKLRGQYGVALDLLTECVYPMKVCAAVVENEVDDDGLERLIEQVREFVAHARGLKKGDTPSTEGEQG